MAKNLQKNPTLAVHLCEPSKTLSNNKMNVLYSWHLEHIQYFYKKTMPKTQTQKDRTYDDFAKSKYYTAFTKFGRYLYDVHVDDPSKLY